MPDPIFADPRLADLYDLLDGPRTDLDLYLAVAGEIGARSVLDIGCGTGSFACRLAVNGYEVVGIDPAAASLEVARRKASAQRVHWLCGVAADLPPLQVDLVTMTGNVAQVFVDDAEWAATLGAAGRCLSAGGHLVFETRRPEARAWQRWNRKATERVVPLPGRSAVRTWLELEEVHCPFVSFWHHYVFEPGDERVSSRSVLRFRTLGEVMDTLSTGGFQVVDVRDAPDRPGGEMVFVARREP